jgi:hypothetical protein
MVINSYSAQSSFSEHARNAITNGQAIAPSAFRL